MATKAWSDFLPWVLPDVRDCPDLIAADAVRNAAIEFCERSRAWRHDLDPITAAANVPEYSLDAPANTVVWEVMSVRFQGQPITLKAPDDLDVLMPGWQEEKGEVVHYFVKDFRRTLRLVRIPGSSVPNAIRVNAALKPSVASSTVEEDFFEEHYRHVAAGAKAALLSMAAKAWTNAAKAKENSDEFDLAIAAHNVSQARGHARGPLRTKAIYSL